MKIKIVADEYEDVTLGKVYEVVEEHPMGYFIIDDQLEMNEIDKEDCEIVKEGAMFKKGDRVQIVVKNDSDSKLLEGWFLQGNENKVGEIVEITPDGEPKCLVDLDDDSEWYVPEQLLQKIYETKEEQSPTLQQIIRFTQNNKGFSIEFDAGKITLADWSNDPNATFYRPKTLEELEELMECVDRMNEFRDNRED